MYCERDLEPHSAPFSHKLSGIFSGLSHPETLPSVPAGSSRTGEDGQHHNSGAYQSPRGLRSCQLCMLARRPILWGCNRFLSGQRTYQVNLGADLLSGGTPMYEEWPLHRTVVDQIWASFGQVSVDLFASRGNAQCARFFSLRSVDAPLVVDALAHVWPHKLLYAFPPWP